MGMSTHKIKGEDSYYCREVKAERDRLRDEVERLKQDISAAREAYTDGILQTAARCAQIADEHASAEGIAQRISTAIYNEFLLGYGAAPPEFGLGDS